MPLNTIQTYGRVMNVTPSSLALAALGGCSLAASWGVWRRYVLLGHPGFKFRMSRAARALLDVAVLSLANLGTATLAISQPRMLLTVVSTLLSPAAKYGVRYGPHPRQTLDIHAAMPGRTAAALKVGGLRCTSRHACTTSLRTTDS